MKGVVNNIIKLTVGRRKDRNCETVIVLVMVKPI